MMNEWQWSGRVIADEAPIPQIGHAYFYTHSPTAYMWL